jgi:hypothetical protein
LADKRRFDAFLCVSLRERLTATPNQCPYEKGVSIGDFGGFPHFDANGYASHCEKTWVRYQASTDQERNAQQDSGGSEESRKKTEEKRYFLPNLFGAWRSGAEYWQRF